AMIFGVLKHKKADYILIDTYSTTNFYYAFFIAQLARLLKIAYIPILHGGNLPERLKKSPLLSKYIFKNSYRNISPSLYLATVFNAVGFKTMVIPNAICLNLYPFKEREIAPKLLWVRAFDQIYNPKMAVEVLILLQKDYPNAELCMIGPDKDRSLNAIKNFAKQKGIENSIEFTGLMTKENWIKKATAYNYFINTSNFDNMPVSVIEAMALGFPVISTNVGGMRHLIHHNKSGILVAKNNACEMAEAIKAIIKNPEIGARLSKNAREQVAQYDEKAVQQMWLNVLQ
uniref:glycosyltransferase family 4 protein n=1 Tax=Lutibacter sp. TaxID=1925666 RepID=UPI0035658B4C